MRVAAQESVRTVQAAVSLHRLVVLGLLLLLELLLLPHVLIGWRLPLLLLLKVLKSD